MNFPALPSLFRIALFLFLLISKQINAQLNAGASMAGIQQNFLDVTAETHLLTQQSSGSLKDTLVYRRNAVYGTVINSGKSISHQELITTLKSNAVAFKKFKTGQYLKPIGPLLCIGGILLGIVAIKGKPASVVDDGVTIDYTVRSAPKLTAGIGAFAAGITLIEVSNDYTRSAVRIYNRGVGSKRVTAIRQINLDISLMGHLSLIAKF